MKRIALIFTIALAYTLFQAAVLFPAVWSAQAAEKPICERKLVGASWHCWREYPCELWYLTRPAKPGEQPEKIVIQGEEKPFDEAAEQKLVRRRGEISMPSGQKLVGASWKCGANGCEASFQLRKSRKGEAAESYLFHNDTQFYDLKETP